MKTHESPISISYTLLSRSFAAARWISKNLTLSTETQKFLRKADRPQAAMKSSYLRQLASRRSISNRHYRQSREVPLGGIQDAYTYFGYARKFLELLRIARQSVILVPEGEAHVLERFGRYNRILKPGLNALYPAMDKVAYILPLKPKLVEILAEPAVTNDGVKVWIDGNVHLKITDPKKAAYAIDKPMEAVARLANSFMRDEIAKMTLDAVIAEDKRLEELIPTRVGAVAKDWGVACFRYQMRVISKSPEAQEAHNREAKEKRVKSTRIMMASCDKEAEIMKASEEKVTMTVAAHGELAARIARFEAEAKVLAEYVEDFKTADGGKMVAVMNSLSQDHIDAINKMGKLETILKKEMEGEEKQESASWVIIEDPVDAINKMVKQEIILMKEMEVEEKQGMKGKDGGEKGRDEGEEKQEMKGGKDGGETQGRKE